MSAQTRILYCHCAYAKVIPDDVKRDVLSRLSASGVAFDAVADLCEMSARKDPELARLAADGDASNDVKIVACFPRAVEWLFHGAGSPLPKDGVLVLNMREESANDIIAHLLPATTGATPEATS